MVFEKKQGKMPRHMDMKKQESCTNENCFFCIMKEQESCSIRTIGIKNCFKEIFSIDDQERVLVLCSLWNMAMTQPDNPEFPSLGIFECMASLISRAINDQDWLLKGQNIYVPYYAAHIIGSYSMNKSKFAKMAVESGVIPPLLDLLRGKMSWVEQRVAVRALGHLASYEKTFEEIMIYEEEMVISSMHLASTCLEVVYDTFVGIKDESQRLTYHCDLLTRGVGSSEMQDRKAEEWASQIQCWSIHLLNCFAIKERSVNLICTPEFLKSLCGMWGGLVNHASPAGVGLLRILCYTKVGRKCIAESNEVLQSLCNLSRSSDDWQYMGIDCILLFLKDPATRCKVIEIATFYIIDLVELKELKGRPNLGKTISKALLVDFKQRKSKIKNHKVTILLQELWVLQVERRRREKLMSDEKFEEKKIMANLIKQQGNHLFISGEIEAAVSKYTDALELCPLRHKRERIVLYSNRAQCYLLLGEPNSAISDTTRALSLSVPPNSHPKSLWRRSQAYDMKGLAKESLMDCLLFINGCIKSDTSNHLKIPYYAVRMVNKQMESTWLFSTAQSNKMNVGRIDDHKGVEQSHGHDQIVRGRYLNDDEIMRVIDNRCSLPSLSTIVEEPLIGTRRRKS